MLLRNLTVNLFSKPSMFTQSRNVSITPVPFLNQKYRQQRKLPLNPNATGVLTDGSDYSFLDGRITPLGQGQKQRLLRDHEAKMQIISLSKEIDFAIERYNLLQLEESNRKKGILDQKLKPKGQDLLTSN